MSNYQYKLAGKKIAALRKQKGISQGRLGKNIGVTQGAISKIERGDTRLSKYTMAIAKFLGVTAEALLDQKVSINEIINIFNDISNKQEQEANSNNQQSCVSGSEFALLTQMIYKVPIISMTEVCDWRNVVDNYGKDYGNRAMANTTNKPKKHTYAIIVNGMSMINPTSAPSLPPGTTVIMEPDAAATHGKFVVVRQTGKDEGVFRRLDKEGGHNYLAPLNPQFPIIEMSDDDIICGVAIEALIKL